MKTIRIRYLWIAAFLFGGTACQKKTKDDPAKATNATDYEQEMRTFIQDIGAFARQQKPGFLIVPQDGLSLLTANGDSTGTPVASYLAAINGVGQEEVYYGYDNEDDVTTPTNIRDQYLRMCRLARNNGKRVLVTDYCTTQSKINTSYANNFSNGFISYAATSRELDNIAIKPPYNVHAGDVTTLNDAKNFLYLINPQTYSSKKRFMDSLKATNFDVLILDAFFNDDSNPLTKTEVESLKIKANGGKRIVLAYMSIAQAEDYRWYWKTDWLTNPPAWLVTSEDPDWEGDYNVRYWMPEWKSIIVGNDTCYTQKLINGGFDGAYLDLYDYQYWEN